MAADDVRSAARAQFLRLSRLLEEALDLPAGARAEYLHRCAADDPALLAAALAALADESDRPDGLRQRVAASLEILAGEPAASQRCGPWRLLRPIGSGGMGEVFLAERADGAFEQRVAVKVLPPSIRTRELGQRLERERQILARLEHPNIARLIDGGLAEDGTPYLALEYVEGVPIDRHCAASRAHARRQARDLPEDVRRGRLRPCPPGGAPRPQADERPRHPRGRGEAAGLRHRQAPRGGRPRIDAQRRSAADAPLRRAGAGRGQAGDDRHGRPRVGTPALRAAHRRAAVRSPDDQRARPRPGDRRAPARAPEPARPRLAARARRPGTWTRSASRRCASARRSATPRSPRSPTTSAARSPASRSRPSPARGSTARASSSPGIASLSPPPPSPSRAWPPACSSP